MACVYLLFVWACIPGMKTLSSNVFFSYCLRLAAHTNTSMMTHIVHRTSNIAHKSQYRTSNINWRWNTMYSYFWHLWRKIAAIYQSVCIAMHTCLTERSNRWSRHKWRWLFYCDGRIICCRTFLSATQLRMMDKVQCTVNVLTFFFKKILHESRRIEWLLNNPSTKKMMKKPRPISKCLPYESCEPLRCSDKFNASNSNLWYVHEWDCQCIFHTTVPQSNRE